MENIVRRNIKINKLGGNWSYEIYEGQKYNTYLYVLKA